jgi:autotransporter-associated beta strand protein
VAAGTDYKHWVDVYGVRTTDVVDSAGLYGIEGFYIHDPWTGYVEHNFLIGSESSGFGENAYLAYNNHAWFKFFDGAAIGATIPATNGTLNYQQSSARITGSAYTAHSIAVSHTDSSSTGNSAAAALAQDPGLSSQLGFQSGAFSSSDEFNVQVTGTQQDWVVPYESAGGAASVTGALMINPATGTIDQAWWIGSGESPWSLANVQQMYTEEWSGDLPADNPLPQPTWTNASGNGLWDTGTSQNFVANSTPTVFYPGNVVTFDDSSGGNYNVTLNTTVEPGGVVFNNSAGNYVISGSGSIIGFGSLSKSGTGIVTLNTVNSYSGGTIVSGGKLIIGVAGALPDGDVSITGGTLQLAAGTGAAQITSLAISGGGTFDIGNNHIIVNYGSNTDPVVSVAAWIASGYNSGQWNGPGIISSVAATTPGSSVGYADSADSGNPAGLASGTIEAAYALLGDADLNGTVNGIDFGILAANFNHAVSRWDQGDFNYDGIVNGIDFTALAANFNKAASGAAVGDSALSDPAIIAFAQANGLMADLPEPAAFGLTLLGLCGVLRNRLRRTTSRLL